MSEQTATTKWFKYDWDYLCVNKSQFVPVLFEPPCTLNMIILSALYTTSIVTTISTRRLACAGHVSNQRAVKKVYEGSTAGRRCSERPRLRWIDNVEEDLRSMGVKRWRTRALGRPRLT
jgi:hypothetical protein